MGVSRAFRIRFRFSPYGLAACVLLLANTCSKARETGGERGPGATPAAPASGPVPIVFTKDIRGESELCGCSTAQAGGLSRKSAVAKSMPGALLVDAGNFLPPADDVAFDLNARLTVAALHKMGYRAVNLGKQEARMDAETLQKYTTDAGLPVVASNLVGEKNRVLFDAYTQVRVPPGRPVVFIGLVGRTTPGKGLQLLDPVKRLQDVLKTVPAGTSKVVLADLDAKETEEVLSQVKGIDLLIGAGGTIAAPPAGTSVAPAAQEYFNEWAGVLKVDFGGAGPRVVSSELKRLDGNTGEDNDLKAFVDQKRAEWLPSLPHHPGVRKAPRGFAGSDTCKPCHAGPYKTWTQSLHSKAFKILELQKVTDRPDCVLCHTTGFDRKDFTYFAQNVGCENCHGPAQKHVALMAMGRRAEALKAIGRTDATTCLQCHSRAHDPNFNFDINWPKIRH